MEYTRLGSTGLKVSRICLGCMSYGLPSESNPWVLNEEQSRPYIKRALEAGSWLILSAHGLPPGIEIVDRVAGGVVHLSFLLEGKARAHVLVAYKLSFQGFVMLSLEDEHAFSS